MEKNEISMLLDVKIDVAVKRNEPGRLKNWTKCNVKIETVKSIPCFLRIKFFQNTENEPESLSIPVHVPGVQVRLTNSRTKTFSYGITWKSNRKRCHIFFAFESKLSFEMHMKWLKESLKNLELHRRETKRRSRDGSSFLNLKKNADLPTKTVQDMLGPLPKIPDKRESMNWSRRISTVSGIYEEIPDSETFRRLSQASGIYEEMKPPQSIGILFQNESPPELPARSRINTFENEFLGVIPRSNTNPETVIAGKKNKIFLQGLQNSLFGKRSKRSESVSENKVTTTGDLINTPKKLLKSNPLNLEGHFYQNIDSSFDLAQKNDTLKTPTELKNRYSFSSPDLSKNILVSNLCNNNKMLTSFSTLNVCESCQSLQNINLSKLSRVEANSPFAVHEKDLFNISDKINETFNLSINSSTINLVGANLNIENNGTANRSHTISARIIDDISGYCSMAPIKNETRNNFCKINEKELYEPIKNSNHCRKLNDSDKENKIYSSKSIYNGVVEFKNSTENNDNSHNSPINDIIRLNLPTYAVTESHYKTPRRNAKNIDEKISSYYPNTSDLKKNNNFRQRYSSSLKGDDKEKNIKKCNLEKSRLKNVENLNNTPVSVQKQLKHEFKEKDKVIENSSNIYEIKKLIPLKACKISENVYSVKKLDSQHSVENINKKNCNYSNNDLISEVSCNETPEEPLNISFRTLLQNIDFKFDDSKNSSIDQQKESGNVYQNYSEASLQTTSSKHLKVNSVKLQRSPRNSTKNRQETISSDVKIFTPESNTTKKITSLQRFKKIDFSPLKLKINNVLQRNNNEGY
ncbi:uncharacterized protein DDB_G0286591 isoform X2 [Condylostylus longicornis]|uniref:uncharacterized protein DDB_G0286591 isoform X2 n=1 Tax=Condylostylus longicornis TaxID=2530218 RepID=UPI00244E0CBB|nr:uncharacterized protein DDB_G0286591 isoform X2 [Condylostylus longicornis]